MIPFTYYRFIDDDIYFICKSNTIYSTNLIIVSKIRVTNRYY